MYGKRSCQRALLHKYTHVNGYRPNCVGRSVIRKQKEKSYYLFVYLCPDFSTLLSYNVVRFRKLRKVAETVTFIGLFMDFHCIK